MTQKVADQHDLLTRWREIAWELVAALEVHREAIGPCDSCDKALRHYDEARNG